MGLHLTKRSVTDATLCQMRVAASSPTSAANWSLPGPGAPAHGCAPTARAPGRPRGSRPGSAGAVLPARQSGRPGTARGTVRRVHQGQQVLRMQGVVATVQHTLKLAHPQRNGALCVLCCDSYVHPDERNQTLRGVNARHSKALWVGSTWLQLPREFHTTEGLQFAGYISSGSSNDNRRARCRACCR